MSRETLVAPDAVFNATNPCRKSDERRRRGGGIYIYDDEMGGGEIIYMTMKWGGGRFQSLRRPMFTVENQEDL